jgi:alpha-tubulin suppressor-like RCC1 family protein
MVAAAAAVVLTAEGEVYTWGHKLVTPRKVSLAGSRDTARAGPAAGSATAASTGSEAIGPAASSSSGAAGPGAAPSSAATSSSSSSGGGGGTAAGEVRFHQGQSEVLRPVAVAVAAGAAHTTCLTRTGVVLTWRSEQLQPVVQVRSDSRLSDSARRCCR